MHRADLDAALAALGLVAVGRPEYVPLTPALECWENTWSEAPCYAPATVRMDDATGSGADHIMLCENHARDYEATGTPWVRALTGGK